jgi:hypothetical protein
MDCFCVIHCQAINVMFVFLHIAISDKILSCILHEMGVYMGFFLNELINTKFRFSSSLSIAKFKRSL